MNRPVIQKNRPALIAVYFIVFFASPAMATELESRLVAIYESQAAGLPDNTYDTFYGADISDDGLLLFRGDTSEPSNFKREAVWKEISPGQVVLVGSNRTEPPAQGFEFHKAVEALWLTSDTIHAEWPNNPDNPTDAIWRFEFEPGNESQLRLAHEGDPGPVPDTTLASIATGISNKPSLLSNARKDIAFAGTLLDDNSQLTTSALFFRSENGPLELVAREGAAATGGGTFTGISSDYKLARDGSLWFYASVADSLPTFRIYTYKNALLTPIAEFNQQPAWLSGSAAIADLRLCAVNGKGEFAFYGGNADGQQFVATTDGAAVSLLWLEPPNRFEDKIDGPRFETSNCQFTDAGEVIMNGVNISGAYTIYTRAILGFTGSGVRTIIEDGMSLAAIPGAKFSSTVSSHYDVNSSDQMALLTEIEGAGIDNSNAEVMLLGTAADNFVVVARTGQLREVRPGVKAPILNLTQFHTGALGGGPNYLSEDGSVAYAAYIDGKGAFFVSAPAEIIHADSFEDPPGVVVNSIADGSDTSPGDDDCDTGNIIANGDTECTLRAAIEELNASTKIQLIQFAIAGVAPHVIQLTASLPGLVKAGTLIRGPVMQEGVAQVVIDGSADGGFEGLLVDADSVTLSGLGIRDFASDGIVQSTSGTLSLSSVHISGNCGFGVYAQGLVKVDATNGGPSLIENNGLGIDCEGGGIFSASASIAAKSVQVFNSSINANNGPGVLSQGPVYLHAVNIENNQAQGVSTQADHASIYIRGGNTYVAGNHGTGIESLGGGIDIDPASSVDVRLNRAWGLQTGLDGRINFGNELAIPTDTSFISFNGAAGGTCNSWDVLESGLSSTNYPCIGGGIAAISEPAIAHRLANLTIEDNGGPGLAAEQQSKLRDVTIRRNRGPGVFVYQSNANLTDVPVLTAELGVNEISANLGHGIVAERGKVVVNQGIELNVRNNAGWGIALIAGVATFGVDNDVLNVQRTITGNGFEAECFEWTYDLNSGTVVPDPLHLGTCTGGGVFSSDFRSAESFFDATTISGNNGPGILTEARVKLSRSIISENESSGIRVVDADNAASNEDLMVYSSLGGNELFSNKGHGIHLETGKIELEEALAMEMNLGFGILLEQGDIDMLQASGDAEKSFIQQGPGGPCKVWNISSVDSWESEVSSCSSGGILLLDGHIDARLVSIRSNAGDGLKVSGDTTLIDSVVCDNTGDQIVTGGTESLTNVTQVCN